MRLLHAGGDSPDGEMSSEASLRQLSAPRVRQFRPPKRFKLVHQLDRSS
jgi:hypothetical protein